MTRQAAAPTVRLVESDTGETTLFIDEVQAMQGWERELMLVSAEALCSGGGEFLEVGLGLGFSALHIAGRHGCVRHTEVEKFAAVIDLFNRRHPTVPAPLQIVHADFFDHLETLRAESLDGVFFDPELPREVFEDRDLLDLVMPKVVRALRPGGRFVPMFSLAGDVPDAATCTAPTSVVLDRYLRFFDRVTIERHGYLAYADTAYTPARGGDAFVLCFSKAG